MSDLPAPALLAPELLAAGAETENLRQQNAALNAKAGALEAYVRFVEQVATSTDLTSLIDAAADIIRDGVGNSICGYFLIRGEVAQLQAISKNTPPDIRAAREQGLPLSLPTVAQALAQRDIAFAEDELGRQQAVENGGYTALSVTPYFLDGAPYALFATGSEQRFWSPQDRAILRSVGQGLGIAVQRLEQTQLLEQQRQEAETRTRALEAFAQLTAELSVHLHPYTLVQRAQEVALSLLPAGYALYFEQLGGVWVLRSQVGDVRNPALQAALDAPLHNFETPTLTVPWTTQEAQYQDSYAQGSDAAAQMGSVQASMSAPVWVGGQPVGVFAIGLFDQRGWSAADRAMLATIIRSLGLALERAQSVSQLAQRSAELEQRSNELEQSNRALARSNDELTAANEELEAFSYSASHDLRTPVRHIKGFAELTRKALRQGDPDRATRHLEVVEQAAERMSAMIDALLHLSRSTRQELNIGPVDLETLVARTRLDLAQDLVDRQVEWRVSPLPVVQGDGAALQQVFTNLLSNAVKFTRPQERAVIEVWGEAHPTNWEICVRDNGVGFDEQYAGKLFGAFQRLHRQDEFEGTGVGLATVRRIMLRHGGGVAGESGEGEGATFRFTLPKG